MLGLVASFGTCNHGATKYRHLHARLKNLANNMLDRIIWPRWVCSMCVSLHETLGGGHNLSPDWNYALQFRLHGAPPTTRLIKLLRVTSFGAFNCAVAMYHRMHARLKNLVNNMLDRVTFSEEDGCVQCVRGSPYETLGGGHHLFPIATHFSVDTMKLLQSEDYLGLEY